MKKIILLIIFILTLTGCTNIHDSSIETITTDIMKSEKKLSNQNRRGYKYYEPTGLSVKYIKGLNEILKDQTNSYYLYVDLVSYYNKVDFNYQEKTGSYYSKSLNYNDKKGYLEINVKNDKYLIEIMYNYAKIEVIVEEHLIKDAITNSLVLLSTIEYNDDIIGNIMGEDVLNYREEKFSIFDTNTKESNFLEIVEEYGTYEGTDEVPDYDLIN